MLPFVAQQSLVVQTLHPIIVRELVGKINGMQACEQSQAGARNFLCSHYTWSSNDASAMI